MIRKRFIKTLIASALFVGFMQASVALAGDQGAAPETPAKAAAPAETAAKAPELPPEAPVALVDGRPITKRELDLAVGSYVRSVSGRMGGKHTQDLQPNDKLRSEMLTQMIDKEILFGEVEKYTYPDVDKKVDEEYAGRKATYPTAEEFTKDLQENGLTEDAYRKLLKRTLSLDAYVETKVAGKGKASEEEAKKFYAENPSYFIKNGESVRASHILVSSSKGDDQAKRDAAKAKAEDIRKRLEAGEDFAALAKSSSDCPSKDEGGDLGFFTKGRMVKDFEDAAFGLETGKLSPVVETEFGYHVIKVTEKKAGESYSYDEAKEKIMNYLINLELNERVRELKKTAKIVIQ